MQIKMIKKIILLIPLLFSLSIAQSNENLPLNPFCQKEIKSVKLIINQKPIEVDIACSDKQKAKGLMNITKLPQDKGMIFIFHTTQVLEFWMKNTLIDLSIAYIDKNWKIIDIQEMKANDLTPVISKKPAIFALEANAYWFSNNNIKIGDTVKMLP